MTWRDYDEYRGFHGTECQAGCKVFPVQSMIDGLNVNEFYSDKHLKAADGGTMVNYDSCVTAVSQVSVVDDAVPEARTVTDYVQWQDAGQKLWIYPNGMWQGINVDAPGGNAALQPATWDNNKYRYGYLGAEDRFVARLTIAKFTFNLGSGYPNVANHEQKVYIVWTGYKYQPTYYPADTTNGARTTLTMRFKFTGGYYGDQDFRLYMALPVHDWYYGTGVTANGVTWWDSPYKPSNLHRDCSQLPQTLAGVDRAMMNLCEYKFGVVDWPTDKNEVQSYTYSHGYNGLTTWSVPVHEQGLSNDDDGWYTQIMRAHMGGSSSDILMDDSVMEYSGIGLDGYITTTLNWVNPPSTKQAQGFKIETVYRYSSTFRYGGGGLAYFPSTQVKDASSGTTSAWVIGYNGEHTSQMSQIMGALSVTAVTPTFAFTFTSDNQIPYRNGFIKLTFDSTKLTAPADTTNYRVYPQTITYAADALVGAGESQVGDEFAAVAGATASDVQLWYLYDAQRMNYADGTRSYPSDVYYRYHPFNIQVAGWTWAAGVAPGTTFTFTLSSQWVDDDAGATKYDIDSFGTFSFTTVTWPTLTVGNPSSDSVSLTFALPSHLPLKAPANNVQDIVEVYIPAKNSNWSSQSGVSAINCYDVESPMTNGSSKITITRTDGSTTETLSAGTLAVETRGTGYEYSRELRIWPSVDWSAGAWTYTITLTNVGWLNPINTKPLSGFVVWARRLTANNDYNCSGKFCLLFETTVGSYTGPEGLMTSGTVDTLIGKDTLSLGGAQYQFKFTTTNPINADTLVRVVVEDSTYLPASASDLTLACITNCESGATVAITGEEITLTGMFTALDNNARAIDFTIKGFTNPSTVGSFPITVWTTWNDGGTYYNIDQTTLFLNIQSLNRFTYETDSAVTGAQATITIKYRISENFDPTKNWLELTVPATNKDLDFDSAQSTASPMHRPGDAATTVTATLAWTDGESDTSLDFTQTLSFAPSVFDYTSWNDRVFTIYVTSASSAVPLRKLPSVTEANFSTDLGKFSIVFASSSGAFMPVNTRHQNAWALKVKKCTADTVYSSCPNASDQSDHETIVTLEEGDGLVATTVATGVGRTAIVNTNDQNNKELLIVLTATNPIPTSGIIDIDISSHAGCTATGATVYCISAEICGSSTPTVSVSGSYLRISNLISLYVAPGARVEFTLVHDCSSLVPASGAAATLSVYTRFTYPETSTIYDLDQFPNLPYRLPNAIVYDALSTYENDKSAELTITLNLEKDVVKLQWVRIILPVSNKDILPASVPAAGEVADNKIANLGKDTMPTVIYKTGSAAEVTMASNLLSLEYDKGTRANGWLQEFAIQLKRLPETVVADPGGANQGYLKITFTNWRNPPISKRLTGFSVEIAEKTTITLNNYSTSRWSTIQKLSDTNFHDTTKKLTTGLQPYPLINAHYEGGQNSEYRFTLTFEAQTPNTSTILITVPTGVSHSNTLSLECFDTTCASQASASSSLVATVTFSNVFSAAPVATYSGGTYDPYIERADVIDFSITGWTNPSDSTPFAFVFLTQYNDGASTYDVEQFTFADNAVVANTKEMSVSVASAIGSRVTTFTASYQVTRNLPNGSYFELTLPPTNYGLRNEAGLTGTYTTTSFADYTFTFGGTVIALEADPNGIIASTPDAANFGYHTIKITPTIGTSPTDWLLADDANPKDLIITIANFQMPPTRQRMPGITGNIRSTRGACTTDCYVVMIKESDPALEILASMWNIEDGDSTVRIGATSANYLEAEYAFSFIQRESYTSTAKYEFSFAPKTFDDQPGIRLPVDGSGDFDASKMCIIMYSDTDCSSSANWVADLTRDSYDSTHLRYVLTVDSVLSASETGDEVNKKSIILRGLTNPGLASGARESDASIKLAVWIRLDGEVEYFIVEVFYFGVTILDPIQKLTISSSSQVVAATGQTLTVGYTVQGYLGTNIIVKMTFSKRNIHYSTQTPVPAVEHVLEGFENSSWSCSDNIVLNYYRTTDSAWSSDLAAKSYCIKVVETDWTADTLKFRFQLKDSGADITLSGGDQIRIKIGTYRNPQNTKPLWDFTFGIHKYEASNCYFYNFEDNQCYYEGALPFATDGTEGVFIDTPQDTDYEYVVDASTTEKNLFETTTGLNIIRKDPAKYRWTFRFDNPVPMNSLLEIQIPPGVSLNQDSDEVGETDKVIKQERQPDLKITQCEITDTAATPVTTQCPGSMVAGALDHRAMQVAPGRIRWFNLFSSVSDTADPSAYPLLDQATFYPQGTKLTLEIDGWQNPATYVSFQFLIYSIWVPTTDSGKEYYIDKYINMGPDMSSAEATQKLRLTVDNQEAGATGVVLTVEYTQDRGYSALRVFQIEVPKNPVHYIEDGFVPTNAVDFSTALFTATLTTSSGTTSMLTSDGRAGIACDEGWGYGEDPSVAKCMGNQGEAVYWKQVGWGADLVQFRMVNALSNAPQVSDASTHQTWTFTITAFTNPPSTKPVTTQWKSKFRQVLVPDLADPNNSYGSFYDTEFVLGFSDETESGIITCTSQVVSAATSTVDLLVLGNHDAATSQYKGAELMFSFEVSNPIPVTGFLDIDYNPNNDDLVLVDQSIALPRCFDDTCGCDPVLSPTACTVLDIPTNKTVHVMGAFSSSLKRSGSTVTFSLSGLTIPDATAGTTPTFVIATRWYTDFTSEADRGYDRVYYDIDSYLGFTLTIGAATEKLTMELVGDGIVGQTTSLQIDYILQRDILPYSWFVMDCPKANADYQTLSAESGHSGIVPTPLFNEGIGTGGSEASASIACLEPTPGSEIFSEYIVWAPDTGNWNDDVLSIRFGSTAVYSQSSCTKVRIIISLVYSPPSMKKLTKTFHSAWKTNRSGPNDPETNSADATILNTEPVYIIMEIVDQDTSASSTDGLQAKSASVGSGDYSSTQAVSPTSFRYSYKIVLANPVHKDVTLEVHYPSDFQLLTSVAYSAAGERTLDSNAFGCSAATCRADTGWTITDYQLAVADAASGKSKKLVITNLFDTYKPAATEINFSLTGWSHSALETCNSFVLFTSWLDGATEYKIDQYNSLLLLTTSRAVDCVLGIKKNFMLAANLQIFRLNSVYGGTTVQRNNPSYSDTATSAPDNIQIVDYYKRSFDPAAIFDTRGTQCKDTNFYSVFAEDANEQRLKPAYLDLEFIPTTGQVQVFFSSISSYSAERNTKHAVYIVARNQADPERVTNWYCFMVTACPEENLDCDPSPTTTVTGGQDGSICRTYCQLERSDPFQVNEILYVVSSVGGDCLEAKAYDQEFGFVSNNEITCPLTHYYQADAEMTDPAPSAFASANPVVLSNYDKGTGGFSLQSISFETNAAGKVEARYVRIAACMAGVEVADASYLLYIYQKKCTEEAFIDYPESIPISMPLQIENNLGVITKPDGDPVSQTWTMATLGFASSNEESCPINLVDDADLTLTCPNPSDSSTPFSTAGVACAISSNVLTCVLTPNSYTAWDEYKSGDVILNKVITMYTTVQLPNPGTTDDPLYVTRPINLEISQCDVTTCATCDENAVDVNVSPANPYPDAWVNMMGEYHSKMTVDERQVLVDLASGCTFCLQGFSGQMKETTTQNAATRTIIQLGVPVTENYFETLYHYERTCTKEPPTPAFGTGCGWGMVYAEDATTCVPCSTLMKGCSVCLSNSQCVRCENTQLEASQVVSAYGEPVVECTNGFVQKDACSLQRVVETACGASCNSDSLTSTACQECMQQNVIATTATCYTGTATAMTAFCDLAQAMVAYPNACQEAAFSGTTCLADIQTNAGCRTMTGICDFDSKCVSCYTPDSVCFACERGYYLAQGYCVQLNTDTVLPTSHYVFFTRNFNQFESHDFINTASWFSGTNSVASYDPDNNAVRWGDFNIWSPFPNQVLGEVNRLIYADYQTWLSEKETAEASSPVTYPAAWTSRIKRRYEVDVFVGPGHYFLFNCFAKFVENYACVKDDEAVDWCSTLAISQQQALPFSDNTFYNYRSLCDSYELLFDTTDNNRQKYENLDQATFEAHCPSSNYTRPIFYIQDPYFHFNITGSMQFEGIDFNGQEAGAAYSRNHYPPASRIPRHKCYPEIKEAQDYYKLPLEQAFRYRVVDVAFYDETDHPYGIDSEPKDASGNEVCPTAAAIGNGGQLGGCRNHIYSDDILCQTSDTLRNFAYYNDFAANSDSSSEGCGSSGMESVRNSTSEPYQEDFWALDQTAGMYYLRQTVLFNLYNLPGGVGMNPDGYANLTLKNCSFEYFVKDYEALVYVENNNMQIQNFTAALYPEDTPNLMIFSDDRGANIRIDQCTFKHSRFKKGMVVYERLPKLQSTPDTTVVGLSREYWYRYPYDYAATPAITFVDSIFEDLDMGLSLDKLSYGEKNATIYGLSDIEYPYVDHHGAILSAQGFPGTITFHNCTISRNLAYIPAVKPKPRSSLEKALELALFLDSDNGQIYLKVCGTTARRFLTDYLNSFQEQPSHLMSQIENYSPVFISKNEGPMIFLNNVFSHNLGIKGGAISIDRPNFVTEQRLAAGQQPPVIVLEGNEFKNNQAYLSGNAVYVRSVRNRTGTDETEEVCGGGFYARGNTFFNNSAVIHSSNGGALSLECEFVTLVQKEAASQLSGTDKDLASYVTEPLYNQIYAVFRFTSAIIENTFSGNEVGQKGSAIHARQISFLKIQDNIFHGNQPGYSWRAYMERPYEMYFLNQRENDYKLEENQVISSQNYTEINAVANPATTWADVDCTLTGAYEYNSDICKQGYESQYAERLSTVADGDDSDRCTYKDYMTSLYFYPNTLYDHAETMYSDERRRIDCYTAETAQDSQVNLPQLQGLIYVEACKTCLVSHVATDDTTCSFCLQLPQLVQVVNNTFTDNYEGLLIFERHTLPRASHFMFRGGVSSEISQNAFVDQLDIYSRLYRSGSAKPELIQALTDYLPEHFFFHLHTPLIRVLLPEAAENSDSLTFTTLLEHNEFKGLFFEQPLPAIQKYRGALLQLESAVIKANLTILDNIFTDVHILAKTSVADEASLIYADGASVVAERNQFSHLGLINKNIFNEGTVVAADIGYLIAPNEWFGEQFTQTRGIFWLKTGPWPTTSLFADNSFDLVFCTKGCVYSLDSVAESADTNLTFKNNTYENIFGESGTILLSQSLEDTSLKFIDETVCAVQVGAFSIEGTTQREVLVSFENLLIEDSYGDSTKAMIDIRYAAQVNCTDCHITNPSVYHRFNITSIETYFEDRSKDFQLVRTDWQRYLSYPSDVLAEDLVFSETLLQNQRSVIYLDSTSDFSENLVAEEVSFQVYQECKSGTDRVYSSKCSIFKDCTFENLYGTGADANVMQAVTGTPVCFRDTIFDNNWADNDQSTTLLASDQSKLYLENTNFTFNVAGTAAAIGTRRASQLIALNSHFTDNIATKAVGAISIDQDCLGVIQYCEFVDNFADGNIGAIKSNKADRLEIMDSNFIRNYAGSMLMLFQSSTDNHICRSRFEDNKAQRLTPGFYLQTSTLKTSDIVIFNSKEEAQSSSARRSRLLAAAPSAEELAAFKQEADEGKAIISGFFLVTSSSDLDVTKAEITRTKGTVASAFFVQIGCQMGIADSELSEIGEAGSEGVVIKAESAINLNIEGTTIKDSFNTYVRAEGGPTNIQGSSFLNGSGQSFVSVSEGSLTVGGGSTFAGNSNPEGKGLGINCSGCTKAAISDTKFADFEGSSGAAVSADASCNVSVDKASFSNSTSSEMGAAIAVKDSTTSLGSTSFSGSSSSHVYRDAEFSDNTLSKYRDESFSDEAFASISMDCTGEPQICDPNEQEQQSQDGDACDKVAGPKCCIQIKKTSFTDSKGFEPDIPVIPDPDPYPRKLRYKIYPDETKEYTKSLEDEAEYEFPVKLNEFYHNSTIIVDGMNRKLESNDTIDWTKYVDAHYQVTSGWSFNMDITLLDENGDIFEDETTTALLNFYPEVPEFAQIKSNMFRATGGVYRFQNVVLVQKPGTTTFLDIDFGFFEQYQRDPYGRQIIPWYNNSPLIAFTARDCKVGEYYSDGHTCETCPKGKNTYIAQTIEDKGKGCEDCLENAICKGASTFPQAGFVRMNEKDFLFVKCFNENACLEGNYELPLKNCDEGYEGVMCANCQDKYWKSLGTFQCYPCSMTDNALYVYIAKVCFFAFFCYWVSRLLFRSFSKANIESVAAVRIFITLFQLFAILSKMEATTTKNGGDLQLQELMDKLVYYLCPDQWILDFDCLMTEFTPSEEFFYRLLITIFMPALLLAVDLCMIWLLTFFVKLCQFRKPEDMKPLNCQRLCNRITVAFSMQIFFVYPAILYTLFASTQCFDSLTEDVSQEDLSRLLLVPEIECESDWYNKVYWTTIVPSLVTYLLIIPLFGLRAFCGRAHWIFHSARNRDNLDDEELANSVSAKSAFGFFYSGLSIGRLLKRDLRDTDYLIENSGTFSDENKRTRFKYCCQGAKEWFLLWAYHPISGKATLVRVTPDHVSQSYFYWEFVILVEKLILIIHATQFNQDLKSMQLILAMLILCVFMAIQMHNEPYFTTRLNRLHSLAIFTCILYCACRVIMTGLVSLLPGGQANPFVEKSIVIPEEYYTYTRGYVDIDSDSTALAIQAVFMLNLAIMGLVVFHFLRIMYQHFLIYLVQMHQLKTRIDSLADGGNESGFSEIEHKHILKYKDDDRCGCCRWNHKGCLEKLLCNSCRKTKYDYQTFVDGPFKAYKEEVEASLDPQFEKDMEDERVTEALKTQLPVLTERSVLVTTRSGKKKKKKGRRTPANSTAPANITAMDITANLGDASKMTAEDVLGNSYDDQAPINARRLNDGAPSPGFKAADKERAGDPRLIQAASSRSNSGVKGKLKNKKVKK